MNDTNPSSSSLWGSLSLRLGVAFVVLLLGVSIAVGFLIDLDRAEVRARSDRAQLRFQGEVLAGTVELRLEQLLGDLQLLAQILPVSEIGRTLTAAAPQPAEVPGPIQGTERLQRILLDFAASRPSYREIRILVLRGGFRELVGVERGPQGPAIASTSDLVGLTAGLDPEAATRGPSVAFAFDRDRKSVV